MRHREKRGHWRFFQGRATEIGEKRNDFAIDEEASIDQKEKAPGDGITTEVRSVESH